MNTLRGPNFDIDSGFSTITETEFKAWNDLLDANLSTSQQIIDQYFSGSLSGVPIGIDYTAFNNFVFYSSAAERMSNFKYKLEMLEFYGDRLTTLNNASGSDSGSLTNNITITQQRIDSVIGTFDGFERWLYFEPTASLTTHGVSGSFIGSDGYALTPWPKYLSGSKYYVHHTTSSLGTNWFNGFYATAYAYDDENTNALVKTIPEHIRTDDNNDQYELFVNMIGHHFDILYTYVEALTKTYRPEEQPKLGASRESLYEIAKSMGWTLANGNQASSLWKYKLGTDSSGSYQSTGSLFSKTDEDITTEVWRRIVNNLPYLLKTKGTARSVKALMSCYGIPQTLLSIREYGGPKVEENVPTLIEDRYAYALNLNLGAGANDLYIPTGNPYESSIGEWGIRRGGAANKFAIAPMTREIRFQWVGSKSDAILWTVTSEGRYTSAVVLQHNASYSGSDNYGRIIYVHSDGVSQNFAEATDWLPIYDGDFWNLRSWWETTGDHFNTGSNTNTSYFVQVQKASDYITGKIIHTGTTVAVTPNTSGNQWRAWAGRGSTSQTYLTIGNVDKVADDVFGIFTKIKNGFGFDPSFEKALFKGRIQEYREWLETLTQDAFDEHTLNPTSYVSGLSPTSSYDTLIRHYTFGSDTIAYDHSVITSVTSSHPANTIKNFSPALLGASTYITTMSFGVPTDPQLGNYDSIEETYYISGVSLGGSLPRSEKIRLEDNYLVRRLSPTNTAERSSFDYAPLDTNRLGLFYSHADQVNKDIFDQIGDVELDDYIGDPNDEFEYQYPDLFHFSKNYWKKYTDRNDVNAYIRIFSQFDFSLFNQIKQLIPARADVAMGLLIEPHALERVKVPLTKRPVVENPQWDAVFVQPQPTASAEYTLYSASIAVTENVINVESLYHTGSNGYSDVGNSWFANMNVGPTREAMDYCTIEINPVDALPSYTASLTDVFAKETSAATDWATVELINILSDDLLVISDTIASSVSSDQLYIACNLFLQHKTLNDIAIDISEKVGISSGNFSINAKLVTLNESNDIVDILAETNNIVNFASTDTYYVHRINFRDVSIPAYTTSTAVILEYTNISDLPKLLTIDRVSIICSIKEVCHSPLMPIIESYRPSNIFRQVVSHYSGSGVNLSKRDRNAQHAYSQSLGLYYSQSLIPATYMDDLFEQTENMKYNGTRISAPDINVNSTIAAIGNSPVIEVYNTNPNQLIFTQNPESRATTGNTEPGNLIVR
jgi:hypothetical protein